MSQQKIFTKAALITAVTIFVAAFFHMVIRERDSRGVDGIMWMMKMETLVTFSLVISIALVIGKERMTDGDRGWILGAVGGLAAMFTLWQAHAITYAVLTLMKFSRSVEEGTANSYPNLSVRGALDYILEPAMIVLAATVCLLLKNYAPVKYLIFVLLAIVLTYSVMFLYGNIFPGYFPVYGNG